MFDILFLPSLSLSHSRTLSLTLWSSSYPPSPYLTRTFSLTLWSRFLPSLSLPHLRTLPLTL